MPVQNLVSASISPETKSDILQKLSDIKSNLSFLLTLQPNEIQGLFKPGNAYAPFVEKAYNAVNSNPQIMAGVFDIAEFKKDYVLSKDLTAIVNQIDQLADGINNTLTAVCSDAMSGALEVYAAVKQNRDKVPGLFCEFFKRVKKKST